MSELYLVLRNRLPTDMEWVTIGKAELQRARKAKGLSYEGAARQLNISSQTVYRREKAGKWPAHEIDALAELYGLEIERPKRTRVTLEKNGTVSSDEDLLRRVVREELAVVLEALLRPLHRLEERGQEPPRQAGSPEAPQ